MVANLLTPGNNDLWLDVSDALNGFLFGWARYFSYGTHRAAFRGIDYYVYERVRDFLARRHKIKNVAQTGSPTTLSMGNGRCCASNAYLGRSRRVPHDEASRRAVCRKSARPVR